MTAQAGPPDDTRDMRGEYADHPRFGRRPRRTGLNPEAGDPGVHLHWYANHDARVPHTAIEADLDRQSPCPVPVTHYFDLRRTCQDCGRAFLFFAEEQKYWYEELGFALDADCEQCFACRRERRGVARHRARYTELYHKEDRTLDEELDLAESYAGMCEGGDSPGKRALQVRARILRLEHSMTPARRARLAAVAQRLLALPQG